MMCERLLAGGGPRTRGLSWEHGALSAAPHCPPAAAEELQVDPQRHTAPQRPRRNCRSTPEERTGTGGPWPGDRDRGSGTGGPGPGVVAAARSSAVRVEVLMFTVSQVDLIQVWRTPVPRGAAVCLSPHRGALGVGSTPGPAPPPPAVLPRSSRGPPGLFLEGTSRFLTSEIWCDMLLKYITLLLHYYITYIY